MSKKSKIIIQSSSFSSESEKVNSIDEARTLPFLYVIDSKGKERIWKCWVENDIVITEAGLIDGKHTYSERKFEGKNLNNKNRTTAEEQAWAEANKKWVKCLDKNYLPRDNDKEGQALLKKVNKEKNKTGGHNINSVAASGARKTKNIKQSNSCVVSGVDDILIPMKANEWELDDDTDPASVKDKVKIHFMIKTCTGKKAELHDTEFYCQPKLDGWRARITVKEIEDEWVVIIASNSGKQYPWFSSLRKLVLEWLVDNELTEDILDGLDGEMYCKQFYGNDDEDDGPIDPLSTFSTISSICGIARSEPHKYEDQIQFHCFDLVDSKGELTQEERFERLDALFKHLPKSAKKRIIKVETKTLQSIDEVPAAHDEYAEQGYEGIILRAKDLKYKPKSRSLKMRKFKKFKDEEYEIIGAVRDKGVSDQHFTFSWKLKTENGDEFTAVQKGSREQKMDWYKNRNEYIGKFLTVKFQEFTEDGIPRFPVAKSLRSGKGQD